MPAVSSRQSWLARNNAPDAPLCSGPGLLNTVLLSRLLLGGKRKLCN